MPALAAAAATAPTSTYVPPAFAAREEVVVDVGPAEPDVLSPRALAAEAHLRPTAAELLALEAPPASRLRRALRTAANGVPRAPLDQIAYGATAAAGFAAVSWAAAWRLTHSLSALGLSPSVATATAVPLGLATGAAASLNFVYFRWPFAGLEAAALADEAAATARRAPAARVSAALLGEAGAQLVRLPAGAAEIPTPPLGLVRRIHAEQLRVAAKIRKVLNTALTTGDHARLIATLRGPLPSDAGQVLERHPTAVGRALAAALHKTWSLADAADLFLMPNLGLPDDDTRNRHLQGVVALLAAPLPWRDGPASQARLAGSAFRRLWDRHERAAFFEVDRRQAGRLHVALDREGWLHAAELRARPLDWGNARRWRQVSDGHGESLDAKVMRRVEARLAEEEAHPQLGTLPMPALRFASLFCEPRRAVARSLERSAAAGHWLRVEALANAIAQCGEPWPSEAISRERGLGLMALAAAQGEWAALRALVPAAPRAYLSVPARSQALFAQVEGHLRAAIVKHGAGDSWGRARAHELATLYDSLFAESDGRGTRFD